MTKPHSPCPFCAGRDIRAHWRGHPLSGEWVIECHSCSCELTGFATETSAWARWNERPSAPEPSADLLHYGWGCVNANGPNGIINWGRSPRSEVWRPLPGEKMVELFYLNSPEKSSGELSAFARGGGDPNIAPRKFAIGQEVSLKRWSGLREHKNHGWRVSGYNLPARSYELTHPSGGITNADQSEIYSASRT